MTTLRWPTPFGYSLFCDDIRREEGGKVTLVGIYGPEMIILGSLPNILPKLAVSVTYVERPGERNEPLELVMYLPGDPDDTPSQRVALDANLIQEFRNKAIPAELAGEDPRLTLNLHSIISPLLLKQEGRMRVRMLRGDTEIRLGSLHILAQPGPSGPAS